MLEASERPTELGGTTVGWPLSQTTVTFVLAQLPGCAHFCSCRGRRNGKRHWPMNSLAVPCVCPFWRATAAALDAAADAAAATVAGHFWRSIGNPPCRITGSLLDPAGSHSRRVSVSIIGSVFCLDAGSKQVKFAEISQKKACKSAKIRRRRLARPLLDSAGAAVSSAAAARSIHQQGPGRRCCCCKVEWQPQQHNGAVMWHTLGGGGSGS